MQAWFLYVVGYIVYNILSIVYQNCEQCINKYKGTVS